MRRSLFCLIGTAVIFVFGTLLRYSLEISHCAAWSLLLSSVNGSAWELWKPYGYSFIGWLLIELSYLRPSLLRFVSAKLIGMWLLCGLLLCSGLLLRFALDQYREILTLSASVLSVLISQLISYRSFENGRHTEIFSAPLIISMIAVVFLLLFLSFYPPDWGIFYDFEVGIRGKMQ